MPAYIYRCDECDFKFQERHSMGKDLTDCPKCKTEGALTKMPPYISIKVEQPTGVDVGKEVSTAIEEGREEVQLEKERLGQRIWKPE